VHRPGRADCTDQAVPTQLAGTVRVLYNYLRHWCKHLYSRSQPQILKVRHVCLSVCPYIIHREPLNGFSKNRWGFSVKFVDTFQLKPESNRHVTWRYTSVSASRSTGSVISMLPLLLWLLRLICVKIKSQILANMTEIVAVHTFPNLTLLFWVLARDVTCRRVYTAPQSRSSSSSSSS
jgi:hypothetical protein